MLCWTTIASQILGLIMFPWSFSKWVDFIFPEKLHELFWVHWVPQLPIYDTGVKLSRLNAVARGISWRNPQVVPALWWSQQESSQNITLVMYLMNSGIWWDIERYFFLHYFHFINSKTFSNRFSCLLTSRLCLSLSLSEHTREGHWVNYCERHWVEQEKLNFQNQSKLSLNLCLHLWIKSNIFVCKCWNRKCKLI